MKRRAVGDTGDVEDTRDPRHPRIITDHGYIIQTWGPNTDKVHAHLLLSDHLTETQLLCLEKLQLGWEHEQRWDRFQRENAALLESRMQAQRAGLKEDYERARIDGTAREDGCGYLVSQTAMALVVEHKIDKTTFNTMFQAWNEGLELAERLTSLGVEAEQVFKDLLPNWEGSLPELVEISCDIGNKQTQSVTSGEVKAKIRTREPSKKNPSPGRA
jgi:hypothetical protein